jgi:hypothetical protein
MRLFSNKGRPRRHRSTSKARRANHNARVDSEVNWCPELQPFTVASYTLAVKSQRRCSDKERPRLLRKPIHNALVNSEMNGLAAFESFTVANDRLSVESQALSMSSPLVTARSDRLGSITRTRIVGSTIHGAFVHPSVNDFFSSLRPSWVRTVRRC